MKNKINKQLLFIVILLVLSILISIMVYNKGVLNIDILAYNLIVENLRTPFLTNIMKVITMLGDANITIIVCLISSTIVFIKNKPLALVMPLNLVIITCINQLIKIIVKRPRPIGYRLIDIGGYSFPSGHAMVSLACYGLYLYIIHKMIKNKKLKIILSTIVIITILLIGISRIYLGVHYLSDVLVGYFTSGLYLLLITKLIDKYMIN